MIFVGILALIVAFLVKSKFVEINTISDKDSDIQATYKRRIAFYVISGLGILIITISLLLDFIL